MTELRTEPIDPFKLTGASGAWRPGLDAPTPSTALEVLAARCPTCAAPLTTWSAPLRASPAVWPTNGEFWFRQ